MSDDWRQPYRSMDQSGSPETAGAVGWAWLQDEQERETKRRARPCTIETAPADGTAALYDGTTLIAATWVFRDPMNFAVLLRWRAPVNELDAAECPHFPCAHTRESFAKHSTCAYGGCPWGGDF